VVHWASGADEHQAHDPWLVPVWAGAGLVVVRTGLGDVGTGRDDDDRRGRGLGDDAGLDCAAQRSVAELAGHFRAATDTGPSFPDARQAVTVTCWPDALHGLASFTVCGAWLSASSVTRLPASAYPPTAAVISTNTAIAKGTSFLDLLWAAIRPS